MEEDYLNQHWRNSAGSNKYMGAYSIPEGQEVELTIKSYTPKNVVGYGGEINERAVITFEENYSWVKPMVLNPTNLTTIERIANSTKPKDFIGLKIKIYAKAGVKNPKIGTTSALRIKLEYPHKATTEKLTVETGTAVWNNIVKLIQQGRKVEEAQTKYVFTKEQVKELMSVQNGRNDS